MTRLMSRRFLRSTTRRFGPVSRAPSGHGCRLLQLTPAMSPLLLSSPKVLRLRNQGVKREPRETDAPAFTGQRDMDDGAYAGCGRSDDSASSVKRRRA